MLWSEARQGMAPISLHSCAFASKLLSLWQPPLVMIHALWVRPQLQRQQGDSDSDEHTKQALCGRSKNAHGRCQRQQKGDLKAA